MGSARKMLVLKLLAVCVLVLTLFLVVPAVSPASAATEYDLWVNNEQISHIYEKTRAATRTALLILYYREAE